MTQYLIIGKDGQLGKEFLKKFDATISDYITLSHNQIDISNLNNVIDVIDKHKPKIIINTSAYNQVDLAENNYDIAFKTNAFGIHNLVIASQKYNPLIVHYSTDYVFDGMKSDGLYNESDNTVPLSIYGKSKLMGESYLKEYNNHLLFRVSWVFGQGEQNFIHKFKQWSKNKILKISSDEVSVPTSTETIVDVTIKAIKNDLRGLYHLTNDGYCSRYEYAKFLSESLKIDNVIYPVNIDTFNLSAKRPYFSAMDNSKIKKDLNIDIESWQASVKKFLSL